MTARIDKAFNDIKEMFKQISDKNKDTLEAALIKPIHEKYPFAQNGICVMIASMGSGKSYNYLKFIAKQEILKPEVVYRNHDFRPSVQNPDFI